MEILQIGESILRQIAEEVTDIDSKENWQLIDNLMWLIKRNNGVGIAAPQIGVSRRVIIVASHPNPRYPDAPLMSPVEMINPKIIAYSPLTVLAEEGCLSVKQQRGMVKRHLAIEVEYYDGNGKFHRQQYNNFIARIIQHEIDHLNGILFVDHLLEN